MYDINQKKLNELKEFFENFFEDENKKLKKLKPIIHKISKKKEKEENSNVIIINPQKFDEEKDDDNKEPFNWLGITSEE